MTRPAWQADAGSNTGSTAVNPLTTCTITVPSGLTSSLLCIFAQIRDEPGGGFTCSTPTVAGSSTGVTAILNGQSPLSGTRRNRLYAWYLLSPSSGNLDISVPVSAANLGIVQGIVLNNVDQTSPIRDSDTHLFEYVDTSGTPQPSITLDSGSDDLIILGLGASDPGATLGGTTLIRQDAGTTGGSSRQKLRSMQVNGTGLAQVVTASVDLASGQEPICFMAISFKPAPNVGSDGQNFPRGVLSGVMRGVAC